MEIKTKFKIGEACYFMDNNRVVESEIKKINIIVNESGDWYVENFVTKKGRTYNEQIEACFDDNELFKTKKELLATL